MAYNLKTPKEKKEKDIFAVPEETKEEKLEDSFSIKGTEEEHIKDINDDLYANDSPIKVKNKSTLFIEANGRTHEVSKEDLVSYHEKYRLDGQDGNAIHGFRELGKIRGSYQEVNKIYRDSRNVFSKIDSHSGGYDTLPEDDLDND